jgi:hypothetical protein
MSALFFIAIFLGLSMVVAATWLVGLWNNVITWFNLVLSGLVATSFFEPLAMQVNNGAPESSYLVDFVAVWALFIGTFIILRIATEVLSQHRLLFDPWTENIGRSVMAVAIAGTLFSFASFTLHLAPLPAEGIWSDVFQPEPGSRSFGIGADRAWMGFVKSASRGSLAESQRSPLLAPYELATETTVREFDPAGELIARYRHRRLILSQQPNLQIRTE